MPTTAADEAWGLYQEGLMEIGVDLPFRTDRPFSEHRDHTSHYERRCRRNRRKQ
jgi:hypothetical protein